MNDDAGDNDVERHSVGEQRLPYGVSDRSLSLAAAIEMIGATVVGCQARDIPQVVTDRLAGVVPIRAAGIWLVNPYDHTLRRSGWSARPAGSAIEPLSPDLHHSLLGGFLRNGHPAQTGARGIVEEILPQEGPDLKGLPVFGAFPLLHGSDRLGIAGLLCSRELSDDEMASLNSLMRYVAAEIVVARLVAAQAGAQPSAAERDSDTLVNFMALIAHELRTPLTGLRGNVQLALMGSRKGDNRRIESRLDAALRLIDSIAALVQNLQDISRVERGIFSVAFARADLTSALWNAVQRVERGVASDRHAIRVVSPEPIIVMHDPRHMEQVFFNLLTNAVAYSPEGGTILVEAGHVDDLAVVSIKDEGIGVPREEQPRIFESYYRGARGQEVNAKGLGLGLAVSQAVVQRHGGTISVQSEPGTGSTFTVRIPLNPPEV